MLVISASSAVGSHAITIGGRSNTAPPLSSIFASRKNTTPIMMPTTVRAPVPVERIGPNANGTASTTMIATATVRAMRAQNAVSYARASRPFAFR